MRRPHGHLRPPAGKEKGPMNIDVPPDRPARFRQTPWISKLADGQPPGIVKIDLVGQLARPEAPDELINLARTAAERMNLAGKNKAIFFLGRGKTGKTTTIRFLAEKWFQQDTPMALLDADRTNGVLRQYFDSVERPPSDDDGSVAAWMVDTVLEAIADQANILIDLGGGDTTLAHLVQSVPSFVQEVERAGGAVVACCTLGSEQDDLMPMARLDAMGLRPTATVLLFNLAALSVPLNKTSFAAIQSHDFYKTLVETRGAAPIFVPVLKAAAAVENRRMTFEDARDGVIRPGISPISPFLRLAIRDWMLKMDKAFEPIRSWLE